MRDSQRPHGEDEPTRRALGIDRITMVLAGEPYLLDVIAFPKNQAGLDPMSGAPSPITQQQLDELGLEVVAEEGSS